LNSLLPKTLRYFRPLRRSLRFTPEIGPGQDLRVPYPQPPEPLALNHHYAWWIAPPWTWGHGRGRAVLPESMILPRSGPQAAIILIRCAGSWRQPGGMSPAAGSVSPLRHRILKGHGAEPGGTMVEVGQGKSAPAGWRNCWPAAPATWPAPPAPPRGFTWWKCSMTMKRSAKLSGVVHKYGNVFLNSVKITSPLTLTSPPLGRGEKRGSS